MPFSESPDTAIPPDDGLPADPAALADIVRERLGRRMIVALLAPPDALTGPARPTEPLRALADMLAAFPGARVAYEQPPDNSNALETFLARLHSLGPDIVLVGAPDETSPATDERPWHLRVFAIADRIGLCDRSLVALAGPRVTRQSARRAGFEDGFSLPAPVDALLSALVREALARDEFRRKGSSPPCYL